MKLNPSPIKLNGDADDSNPHWSWRLSVAVGDWHRSRSLSIAVGDWCQSWHLSITVGDRRRSRRLSIAIGTVGNASTRRWCQSLLEGSSKMVSHFNSTSSSSSTPSFVLKWAKQEAWGQLLLVLIILCYTFCIVIKHLELLYVLQTIIVHLYGRSLN